VLGDRILAIGQLDSVADAEGGVADRRSRPGRRPRVHRSARAFRRSLFLDGALASHLHQGFTTQLSGNCGESLAPITDAGREIVDLALRANDLEARWSTFAEYLDRVGEQPARTERRVPRRSRDDSGFDPGARTPVPRPRRRWRPWSTRPRPRWMRARSGLSSGLIYVPGMHARPIELEALVAAVARRDAMYSTHMRNEGRGLFESLDEAIGVIRAVGPRARLQVSHLKCGSRAVWDRAGEAVGVLEAARSEGFDVAADQYPYTAAGTTLATILPPALQALGVDACVEALADPHLA
jgi:N-acyl-D-amino-acid deacylase